MRLKLWSAAVLLASCVTDTAYQRATALQDGRADLQEVVRSLGDENWKLRCLAARACGRLDGAACTDRVVELALTDPREDVRTCAVEGLVVGCAGAGRSALARLAHELAATPRPPSIPTLPRAVRACPSADAVLALLVGQFPGAQEVTAGMVGAAMLPEDPHQRERFLVGLLAQPAPHGQTELALTGAREQAQAIEREAAEARAQEERRRRQEVERSLRAAQLALSSGDHEAAAVAIDEAGRLGEDVSRLRERLAALRHAKGKAHRDRAWKLAAAGRPDEAEQERLLALGFDLDDPELTAAIRNSPAWLKRARSIEANLPVGIREPYESALWSLSRAGWICSPPSPQSPTLTRASCRVDLDLSGPNVHEVGYSAHLGLSVSMIDLKGTAASYRECRRWLEQVAGDLGRGWSKRWEHTKESTVLNADLRGDRTMSLICRAKGTFWGGITDAWTHIDTKVRGGVLSDVTGRTNNAGYLADAVFSSLGSTLFVVADANGLPLRRGEGVGRVQVALKRLGSVALSDTCSQIRRGLANATPSAKRGLTAASYAAFDSFKRALSESCESTFWTTFNLEP